jgi:hypothetical protein
MTLETDLHALEQQFWTGDEEFYRSHLDDKCLVAFVDMAGVMSKEDIAKMVSKDPPHWHNLKITGKGFVQPSDTVAVLSYQASGDRDRGGHYEAIVSSGYVKRKGQWKMAFHQQTPLNATSAPGMHG